MFIVCGLKVTMKWSIGELDENSNMLSGKTLRDTPCRAQAYRLRQ